jgi:hypothetical protein
MGHGTRVRGQFEAEGALDGRVGARPGRWSKTEWVCGGVCF